MRLFSSLRGRIFVTTALLALMSIGAAINLVSVRVTRESEAALQREINATGALVEQFRATRGETFTMMARLIADAPRVKAAVDTNDPATVQDIASEYQTQLHSNLLLVTNESGQVLATVGASPRAASIVASQPSVRAATEGREGFSLIPQPEGMLQLVTVPIAIGLTNPEIQGTLSVGFLLDDAFAAQLKAITGSEIAFGMDGQVLATTLPAEDRPALAALMRSREGRGDVILPTGTYIALPLPLSAIDATDAGTGAVAVVLRSRAEQLALLRTINAELAGTALVAVLGATLLSFGVARTITRPLAAITDVMREVSTTGDLTRKIAVRKRRGWADEDAQLLATTFNTLTDSIARFQREVSQKERLSALGRLSTVIAHEIRNPLMIIKSALHTLRRPGIETAQLGEAVADIDEEVARLNRVVNDVLDFARPIQFEWASADVNQICRESAAAAQAGPGPEVQLDLAAGLPPVITDAERLRGALVNLVLNARHAAEAQAARAEGAVPGDRPVVVLSTQAADGRVAIVVSDRGPGIAAGDLARVFDPYFTTKRGGTGLGLPIARNIIEGLGGVIAIASQSGRGTEIRIELPVGAPPP